MIILSNVYFDYERYRVSFQAIRGIGDSTRSVSFITTIPLPLKTTLLLPIFLLLVSCVACQNSPREVQLRMAVHSGIEGDALRTAVREYQADMKGKGKKIVIEEFTYDDLFAVLKGMGKESNKYDVVMLDDPWFSALMEQSSLTNLVPFLGDRGPDQDFVKESLDLCRHPYAQGDLYALPYVGNSQLFAYRDDLFEKYHIKEPETWDDVLNAAQLISEFINKERAGKKNAEPFYGYVMRAARGNAVVTDFLPIFWAFGANLGIEEGRPTVNSPEAVEALEFMLKLKEYSPKKYTRFNADEVSAYLLYGKAAQSINWPAWIPAFRDHGGWKDITRVKFQTLPRKASAGCPAVIGNWLLAIPDSSSKKQAAFEFLDWATSKEQMAKSARNGNPPTRMSVFHDPELVEIFPSYKAQLASLRSSRRRPRTPLWKEIEDRLGDALNRANKGEVTPKEALDKANEEITGIIAGGQNH